MITKRIRNAEAGCLVIVSKWARAFPSCGFTTAPATALILPVEEMWSIFCCWAAINPPKNEISSVPKRWRAL